jgi:hypothetical protein
MFGSFSKSRARPAEATPCGKPFVSFFHVLPPSVS